MKALIPTDFSKSSKIAIQYVLDLNTDVEFEMVLLHVIARGAPAMARLSSKKLEEAIKQSCEKEMNELIETIKKENSNLPKISSHVIFAQSIEKAIERFALINNIDIICIGTKGASGIKKFILGSNAAAVIENSSIPVLTIPEFAKYKGNYNIVYSSDFSNIDEELESIIPFAKLMNSWIHILHIEKQKEILVESLQEQEQRLRATLSYQKIKVIELKDDSIIHGINHYVTDINADIVTMFTHHTNLMEKIFHTSITQNMAFQTKTPLLTFQK